jgi:hypothetical protein
MAEATAVTRKTIVLHIGTNKTGSTALQTALGARPRLLGASRIRFYPGIYIPTNAVELHAAAMRPDRMTTAKRRFDIVADEAFSRRIADHVRTFVDLCPQPRIVFSAEGLSHLRYPDEIEWLTRLFEGCNVQVVVYLRDKASFLASYRRAARRSARSGREDLKSHLDLSDESWLADYDALLDAYAAGFGRSAITVRSYEADQKAFGGTVSSFVALLGIPERHRTRFGEPRVNATR